MNVYHMGLKLTHFHELMLFESMFKLLTFAILRLVILSPALIKSEVKLKGIM